MNVYAIEIKKTTIDENNILEVETEILTEGFTDKSNAVKKIWELTDNFLNECLEEIDEESDEENVYRDSNEQGDWQCVHCCNDTHEYSVVEIKVN